MHVWKSGDKFTVLQPTSNIEKGSISCDRKVADQNQSGLLEGEVFALGKLKSSDSNEEISSELSNMKNPLQNIRGQDEDGESAY